MKTWIGYIPHRASRLETIQLLRSIDLRKLSMMELGSICQRLGASGRGSRKELIQRIQAILVRHSQAAD